MVFHINTGCHLDIRCRSCPTVDLTASAQVHCSSLHQLKAPSIRGYFPELYHRVNHRRPTIRSARRTKTNLKEIPCQPSTVIESWASTWFSPPPRVTLCAATPCRWFIGVRSRTKAASGWWSTPRCACSRTSHQSTRRWPILCCR